MRIKMPSLFRPAALSALLALVLGVARADEPRKDEVKIVLPKDSSAVVISYDPGAGGFVRKGEAPFLKIQADGRVTVTNLHDGSKKESKLTVKELDDLLKFIVGENEFFSVEKAKIDEGIKDAAGKGPFLAVSGAGTSVIAINVNDKKHEVSFRAASAFLKNYPNVKMLGQFVAVEKKLSEMATTIVKGKEK